MILLCNDRRAKSVPPEYRKISDKNSRRNRLTSLNAKNLFEKSVAKPFLVICKNLFMFLLVSATYLWDLYRTRYPFV